VAIDPGIALGVRPMQLKSPIEQQTQILTLRDLQSRQRQSQQAEQQQQAEAQQAERAKAALQRIVQETGGLVKDGQPNEPALKRIGIEIDPAFEVHIRGELAKSLPKPAAPAAPQGLMNVGGRVFDPNTRQMVYEPPEAPAEAQRPQVVSGRLVDPTGKVLYEPPVDTSASDDRKANTERQERAQREAERHNKASEAIARINAGRGGANDSAGLVDAVIENPSLFDQITPTARGEIAAKLRDRGFTGFGKPLSDAAAKHIAETKSALDGLKDLRSVLQENEQYIGPVAGLQAMNPYSAANKAQAKIDLVRQRVGKALEGGVLRKEDEEKYKKILATLRDTPDRAIYKVDELTKTLENDVQRFINEQRLSGRRVNTEAANTAPRPGGLGSDKETAGKKPAPTVGSTVTYNGKRYKVKAIVNGQAELEAAP